MRITRGLLPHVMCSCLLLTWATDSFAGNIWWFGKVADIEFSTWPPYCKAKASVFNKKGAKVGLVSKAEEQRWENYFGPAFQHLHHYCKGLLLQFRAGRPSWIARSGYPRKFIVEQVPNQFNYTWSRLPPTHPFYGKMGADLLLARQDAGDLDGAKDVIKVLFRLRARDRYTYTGAADFYRKQEDLAKAIEILEIGAKNVEKNRQILADLAQDHFDQKQYEKSREYARLARSQGMKLVRLGKQLEEVEFPISEE